MAKKFEDMTEEEKREAFEKWQAGRTTRRAASKVRRAAMEALKKAHLPEYNELLKELGGKASPKAK